MYIKVSNNAEAQKAINALEEMGLTNSMYSAEIGDCEGIATYLNSLYKERVYIILNGAMMGKDPYSSWINNRKEMESLDALLQEVKTWLAHSL